MEHPPGWLSAHHSRWRTDPNLLGAALARCGLAATKVERLIVGQSHEVYRVGTGSGEGVVVRVAHSESRVEVEAAVIERVHAVGVPVPEVLWWEALDHGSGATGLIVQRWAPGARLAELAQADPPTSAELMVQAGRWLALIHQVTVDGFGDLDAGLKGAYRTYGEWFVDLLVASQRADVEAAVAADSGTRIMVDQAVNFIVAHRGLVDAQLPRLAHGDFSPSNILVTDGRISAIIDWEGAKGAPRANDFAWWASIAEGSTSNIGPLVSGYSAELGEDLELGLMYLLAQARILVSMLYFSAQVANHDGYRTAKHRLERVLLPNPFRYLAAVGTALQVDLNRHPSSN